MFEEDVDTFFDDFGVTAQFASETANVLFDSPDRFIADGFVTDTEYFITYKTGLFSGLVHKSTIIVDGVTFKVNTIQAIDDGKLTRASLSKS